MDHHRVAIWTLVGMIVGFKLATMLVILFFAWPAVGEWDVLIALHWPFVLPPLLLAVGPAVFWFRLIRVRAKRRRLQRSEWDLC